MKKDIDFRKVEDLAIAIVPRTPDEAGFDEFWDAYIINLKDEPIHSVMVNSTGYGEVNGAMRRTSTLRYFWDSIGPLELEKIESIHKSLFNMASEYWVSFSHDDYLYDKKYVFVQGSLELSNLTEIPFLHKKGVMIR